MDNKISEIRKKIKALRVSMFEAEDVMHDQIRRDEECSEVARQILTMRAEMVRLVRERTILGDREPISVNFSPRCPVPVTAGVRPAKRRLKRVG
jgi:uncharacterized protein YfkK (UPF0435 family)